MRPTRATVGAVLLGVVVVAAGACGSGAGSAKAVVAPPSDRSVAEAASALLSPFHLQVQRSSLGEKPEPHGGSELSLYAQPAATQSVDVYAQRFMPLAAKVVPALFAKYPGIEWIDLCQEPAKSSGTWETVPVTRLEISRAGSARVDWPRGDLATVLALNRTRPLELSIEWHNGIGATSVWTAATVRAAKRGG